MTYTKEQAKKVGAEWCKTCRQYCLPLPPLGTCGFCSMVPKTGRPPKPVEPLTDREAAEYRRARWRANQERRRAKQKEAA